MYVPILRRKRCTPFALLFPALFLTCLSSYEQTLGLQDHLPDTALAPVLRYRSASLHLRDFGPRAVILHFWDSRCSSSYQSLAAMDSIQAALKGQVQVVAVTTEPTTVIEGYLKKHRASERGGVPIVTQARFWRERLPKEGYPYTVWLDSAQRIRFITQAYNATVANLRRFAAGDSLLLPYAAVAHKEASLWKQDTSLYAGQLLYYSYITPCLTGVSIGNGLQVMQDRVRYSCTCCSIAELYKTAYGEGMTEHLNKSYSMRLEVRDKERYTAPREARAYQAWKTRYGYNYDLALPLAKKADIYKIMREDLSRFFSVMASLERQAVKGYTLVELKGAPLYRTGGGAPRDGYDDVRNDSTEYLTFVNQPMSRLSYLLAFWVGGSYPFANNTSYSGKVDVRIRKQSVYPLSIPKLRADLQRYNLDLRETPMETDVLILRD